jgi:hypothetical protein
MREAFLALRYFIVGATLVAAIMIWLIPILPL